MVPANDNMKSKCFKIRTPSKGFEVSWILILTVSIIIAIIATAILIMYKVQTGGISAGEEIKEMICIFKGIVGGC